MTALIAATNLFTNPSAETNVTGVQTTATGQTAVAQDLTRDWAGVACFKTTGDGTVAYQGMRTNTAIAAAVLGDTITGFVACSGTAGIAMSAHFIEFDAGGVILAASAGTSFNLADAWVGLPLPAYVTTNAACAYVGIRVYRTASGAAMTLYCDCFDIRKNAAFDTYVDGSMGTGYSWSGTAHASTSTRAAATAQESFGQGGLLTMAASIKKASMLNVIGEDISDYVVSGSVSVNIDSPITGMLGATIQSSVDLTSYSDCVAVFLTVTDASGAVETRQQGLYVTVPPPKDFYEGYSYSRIQGFDITWLLQQSAFTDTYVVTSGAELVTAAMKIASDIGLTRFAIPVSTKTAASDIPFPAKTTRLEAMNSLLNAAGYYAVTADYIGQLTSYPYLDLPNYGADRSFTGVAADGIVGVIAYDPTERDVSNQVLVIVDDPSRAPITYTATNDNPASEVSTVSLGSTANPRYLTYVHNDPDIADLATATATANRILQERSALYIRVDLVTLPKLDANVRDIFSLEITNSEGLEVASGSFLCRGYTLNLVPSDQPMTHHLAKIQRTTGVT